MRSLYNRIAGQNLDRLAALARHVGDWVAAFDAGRIVEWGPPAQIFDAPATERTRDFLSHLGWAG